MVCSPFYHVINTDCRAERFSEEIVMPPARTSAAAATKTVASTKVAAKKGAAPASKAAALVKKAAAPARKAATAKAVPQATITLKHIAAELAEGHDRRERPPKPFRTTSWRSSSGSSQRAIRSA
jgi:ribosomal protein S16